jgi:hypothetical protein
LAALFLFGVVKKERAADREQAAFGQNVNDIEPPTRPRRKSARIAAQQQPNAE